MGHAMLEAEIRTFDCMLPKLRQEQGAVWALVVGTELLGVFRDFQEAADYAIKNVSERDFLIRHTQEHTAHIPFIAVAD